MEELINSRVKGIEISGIRKFYNLVSQYKDVISLTIGQPDFFTPEHIKQAAIDAIKQNSTVYTHNAGLLELRVAAANYFKDKYNLDYNPENEIIVTNGGSEAIDISLRAILCDGDEVILPGPVYPGYEPIIKLCGAKPVLVDTRNSKFKLTADLIKQNITDKTKCIILPYPSNPTGCLLTYNELQEISILLKDKNIFVLSDEIYSELIYEGKHNSIAAFPGMKEKSIIINGLSKSHSMTGWRIGFVMSPEYISKQMLKVHQYNTTCSCSISQYAGLEAVKNGADDAEPMRAEYNKRRDYVYDRLVDIGFDAVKPQGAFYIFPSIEKFNMSSEEFAFSLLDKARVAVVPGSAFSIYGDNHIRISYACSMEKLSNALDRIQNYLRTL